MKWFVEHLHRDGSVLARVPVTGEVFRIGRALDNDLVLDDPHCAAHHATLEVGADGTACLRDLDTRNGIEPAKGRRHKELTITDEQPVRLGLQTIRVRCSAWALAPELPLRGQHSVLWALLAVVAVVVYALWATWLGDVGDEPSDYIELPSAVLLGAALWSSAFALLGRFSGGVSRFWSHLLILCGGLLGLALADELLNLLAVASGWLWPLQIEPFTWIAITALTIRAHLKQADPRHWTTMRWAWGAATLAVLIVPTAQRWISDRQLTPTQTMDVLHHPAVRLAQPASIGDFVEKASVLQEKADRARDRLGSDGTAPEAEDAEQTKEAE
jgi:hypothetical protein